jgi:hypothetical protein
MSALKRTSDARPSLQEQFDAHKCELEDMSHLGSRVRADILVSGEPYEEEDDRDDDDGTDHA